MRKRIIHKNFKISYRIILYVINRGILFIFLLYYNYNAATGNFINMYSFKYKYTTIYRKFCTSAKKDMTIVLICRHPVLLGKMMWRFSDRGRLRPGYPAQFAQVEDDIYNLLTSQQHPVQL